MVLSFFIIDRPPLADLICVHPSMNKVTSPGGLSTVLLEHGSGASAAITLFGATVTSYKAIGGSREVLFLSKQSILDGSKGKVVVMI